MPGMSALELILPFGLPPPELASDLLRQLEMPAFARLMGRAELHHRTLDPYAGLLPHQDYLLTRAGVTNLAAQTMQVLQVQAGAGSWLLLHPCHFHIARDHLVLTDMRALSLEEVESRALFDAAQPCFSGQDLQLAWGNAHVWFLRAEALAALNTSAPDAAAGHNIDIWMPKGEGERAWRRLHNEVQMLWHDHPVNQEREARGHKPVNALWCWNARSTGAQPLSFESEALRAFLPRAPLPPQDGLNAAHAGGLHVLDCLAEPALAGDWGAWLQIMQQVERAWIAPALQHLVDGHVKQLRLVISDGQRLLQADCSRLALRKFWNKPSLAALAGTGRPA